VSGELDLPQGYVASRRDRAVLVAAVELEHELKRLGLDQPAEWETRLKEPTAAPGRGATSVLQLSSGRVVRLKRLRRGGWTAALWRDHFGGRGRPLANLRVAHEAGRLGIATPPVLALLMVPSVGGLVRAWLAVEELTDAVDLHSCFLSDRPPTHAELDATLVEVRRMHDRGLAHRDLNLGNLLIRRGTAPQAFVIDLDRARLHVGPLGFHPRQRALRRLERSYVKSCVAGSVSEDVRNSIYTLYAADDRGLAARLEHGRHAGRVWISLHRLAWRR
jgi:hypothetical protein